MSGLQEVCFKNNVDEMGNLTVVEGGLDIPFDIKRIFYIYGGNTQIVRGQHANRYSEFVLICVSGKCRVRVDDGKGRSEVYELNEPYKGLYVPRMYWKEMYDFEKNTVLLAFSSCHYDAQEYIRSYEEFLKTVKEM